MLRRPIAVAISRRKRISQSFELFLLFLKHAVRARGIVEGVRVIGPKGHSGLQVECALGRIRFGVG
jgi:hypothetical protein